MTDGLEECYNGIVDVEYDKYLELNKESMNLY